MLSSKEKNQYLNDLILYITTIKMLLVVSFFDSHLPWPIIFSASLDLGGQRARSLSQSVGPLASSNSCGASSTMSQNGPMLINRGGGGVSPRLFAFLNSYGLFPFLEANRIEWPF
jgi:hypothetical protein